MKNNDAIIRCQVKCRSRGAVHRDRSQAAEIRMILITFLLFHCIGVSTAPTQCNATTLLVNKTVVWPSVSSTSAISLTVDSDAMPYDVRIYKSLSNSYEYRAIFKAENKSDLARLRFSVVRSSNMSTTTLKIDVVDTLVDEPTTGTMIMFCFFSWMIHDANTNAYSYKTNR